MPNWKQYRPGDENKRIENYVTHCPIMVFIIDLKNNDEIVYQVELDYSNHADRKRLGRLTFWAVMNRHSVETMHKSDAMGEE